MSECTFGKHRLQLNFHVGGREDESSYEVMAKRVRLRSTSSHTSGTAHHPTACPADHLATTEAATRANRATTTGTAMPGPMPVHGATGTVMRVATADETRGVPVRGVRRMNIAGGVRADTTYGPPRRPFRQG